MLSGDPTNSMSKSLGDFVEYLFNSNYIDKNTHSFLKPPQSPRTASKRELQLQAGLQQHACKVVWPGRVFLRRIFDAMARPQQPHHPTHLNKVVRSNLAW